MRTGIRLAAITAAMTIGLGTTLAGAAHVSNGNFERGNLSGWEQDYLPGPQGGLWFAHEGPFSDIAKPRGPVPATLPAPPQGDFAAVADQNDPKAQFLSQVVKPKPDQRHRLRFHLAYRNRNTGSKMRGDGMPGFITPRTFSRAVANQQFRMDVMKPNAPIGSLRADHVLKRVYRTEVGDRNVRPYRRVRANLTKLAGRKVRLRFAIVVTEAPLHVGIDAVKVKSKRIG